MDCAFEETLHKIRDVTQSALERAEASAKLVERLEEETKKLKELTDSFNEKRMQDEKEMEEIRLRMELEDKEKGYPPRPSPAPVCSPTSPAETSLASCHESRGKGATSGELAVGSPKSK